MTWPARITGLDLSLGGTGICHVAGGAVVHLDTVKSKTTGHERLREVIQVVRRWAGSPADPHLVVIEGPSYASKGGLSHERAGLWWLVAHRLWENGIPYAVMAPTSRAKYATGRGGAGKDEVLIAAVKRFGHLAEIGDNNQADALILAAAALDHLGQPLAPMPATNRSALDAVAWPGLLLEEAAA